MVLSCGAATGSGPAHPATAELAPTGELGDTWTWNGSAWSKQSVRVAPSPRTGAAIAFDSVRGITVLFGGLGPTSVLGDTWTWNGRTWTQQNPVHRPGPRSGAAMAFEPLRGAAVLFGGDPGKGENQLASDTWSWDGTDWELLQSATFPKRRYGAGLVFDAARQALVLFGGHAANLEYFDDTWTWTKTGWVALNAAHGPSPRGEAAVNYDIRHGQLTAFGGVVHAEVGIGSIGKPIGETWVLDQAGWAQRSPARSPSPRFAAASTYDLAANRFILFGGLSCPKLTDELWAWDGESWTVSLPAVRPTPRWGAAMTFDPVRGRTMLFGGSTAVLCAKG